MKCAEEYMRLYAVTDRAWVGGQTLYQQVESALKGGVTCVQLREKELDEEAFLKEAFELHDLCKKYNVPFFINDNVDIAIRCHAEGIHVGQEDMAAAQVRQRVGDEMMIGVSVHSVEEALEAVRHGADSVSYTHLGKPQRIKKGYHAALVLDLCFAAIAFVVIEALHTQISALFLGKDGTALAYQVSGDYMRWIGYFFIVMGIKMATDGVLRGLGIMRPFLVANIVNLAIRLSVALICAPRFGIAFVWLAVPVGWLANFLISYVALRRSWSTDKMASIS